MIEQVRIGQREAGSATCSAAATCWQAELGKLHVFALERCEAGRQQQPRPRPAGDAVAASACSISSLHGDSLAVNSSAIEAPPASRAKQSWSAAAAQASA